MANEEQNINGEEQVGRLVGTLKRVGAPRDFDFRVKARIAKGKPVGRPVSWLPSLVKVGIPLVLVVLVGGYFALNTYRTNGNAGLPEVAVSQNLTIPAPVQSPRTVESVVPSEQVVAGQSDGRPEPVPNKVVVKTPEQKPSSRGIITDRSGSGSYDEAVREVKKIYPRGFNPTDKVPLNPKGFDINIEIPAKDILTQLGITATYDGTGWKVSAVGADTLAEHSTVKTGDVIEAIDSQKLVEKTSFPNRFTGKRLRILRDGKSIQVDLKH